MAKPPDKWDASTALVFAWGQSMCSNDGRGRYTARHANTWVYGGAGTFYPCTDPIVGASGTAGSVWSHCADAAIGRPFNGGTVTRFVLRNIAVGGSAIHEWSPGGGLNATLIAQISDFMANVGMPTHLAFSQGEADVNRLSVQQWSDGWLAMVDSIRAVGCTSKIWTSIETICCLRLTNEQPNAGPANYVEVELGRQQIRQAQLALGNLNENTRQGPDLDIIDWRLRAYGDGCHFGELGLAVAGRSWATALFP